MLYSLIHFSPFTLSPIHLSLSFTFPIVLWGLLPLHQVDKNCLYLGLCVGSINSGVIKPFITSQVKSILFLWLFQLSTDSRLQHDANVLSVRSPTQHALSQHPNGLWVLNQTDGEPRTWNFEFEALSSKHSINHSNRIPFSRHIKS